MLWDLITAICQELRKKWAGLESNFSNEKTSQGQTNKELSDNSKKHANFKTVHNPMHKTEIYPELQEIITAWPKLPDHVRQVIRTLVETSANKHDNNNKDL